MRVFASQRLKRRSPFNAYGTSIWIIIMLKCVTRTCEGVNCIVSYLYTMSCGMRLNIYLNIIYILLFSVGSHEKETWNMIIILDTLTAHFVNILWILQVQFLNFRSCLISKAKKIHIFEYYCKISLWLKLFKCCLMNDNSIEL